MNFEKGGKSMTNIEEFNKMIDKYLDEDNEMTVDDSTIETQDSDSAVVPSADSFSEKNVLADDLPIFTATLNELEFWHACVNCHIQKFLRDYDFGSGSVAYDSFKIGVDEHNHALTFAIDDTHYLKIDLTDNNFLPIDSEQAEKVLRKVNDLRFAHNKKLSRRYEVIREIPTSKFAQIGF